MFWMRCNIVKYLRTALKMYLILHNTTSVIEIHIFAIQIVIISTTLSRKLPHYSLMFANKTESGNLVSVAEYSHI